MHRVSGNSVLRLAALLLFSALACRAADDLSQLRQNRDSVHWTNVPRQVLAFYYGWYGNPATSGHWVHWENVDPAAKAIHNATHYPALGAYDSHDPKILQRHCRMARQAGLTGFIATWWGPGDFSDTGLPLLLDAAKSNALAVTVYYEVIRPESSPKPAAAAKDLLYLLEHYAGHPAWLHVDGKPVLFIYSRAVDQLKPDGWLQVINEVNQKFPGGAVFIGDQITTAAARVFDGVHAYNPAGYTAGKSPGQIRAWASAAYPDWVRIAGPDRISCLTIIPGYDDTKLGRPNPRPVTDRHGDQTMTTLFEAALAANPDWLLITSWNEWHEGSEIEPSLEDSNRALKTVHTYAPQFLAQKPSLDH